MTFSKFQVAGRQIMLQFHSEHLSSSLFGVVHKYGIAFRNLWLKIEGGKEGGIAKVMVKMPMCAKIMYRGKPFFFDIIYDSVLFTLSKRTTVNDDTFLCLVTDNVAVLLERINLKSLDFKHK